VQAADSLNRQWEEETMQTLKITSAYSTIQCGETTGPLKSIEVGPSDPNDYPESAVCVTLMAAQRNEPDEEETAQFFLNVNELKQFIGMLTSALEAAQKP
jgi:hypothetical protein